MRRDKRILIIPLFFILGLLIPALLGIKVGRSYRARVDVRVKAPSDPRSMEIFMKNEAEFAGSYAVMERIAYKLGLIEEDELSLRHESEFYSRSRDKNPPDKRSTEQVRRIVESIRKRIEVENPPKTNLLLFTAAAKTKAQALKLAQIAAQQYIGERAFLERENLEEGIRFILSELKAKEKELEEARREVSDYLKRHPDFVPSSDVRSISKAMARYSGELEEINIEINSRRRELQVVKSLIQPTEITPQYIVRISSFSMRLISDPIISTLIEEMRRLRSERAKLLRRYTEIHPKVKENQARIEKISSRLAEEIKTKLKADMDEISAEISDLEGRREAIQRKIAAARRRISRLSRLQGEYALIESKARSLSELRSMLRGKLEEYKLKTLEKPDIAAIVEPARLLSPLGVTNRLRNMAIGGLIGLFIGIILTMIPSRRVSRKAIPPEVGVEEIQIPTLIVPNLEWDELVISYADEHEDMRAVDALLPKGLNLILGYSPDGRRTSLGFNLAIYRARKGIRTILVGFAPQDERLSRLFGVEEVPGLTDVSHDPDLIPQAIRTATDMLFGMIEVETLANAHGIDYLSLLPYGSADRKINMENLEKVLSDLRGWYESVILDCTSALPDQIDGIRSPADGILIVCHVSELRSRGFGSLIETLGEERSKSVVVALR
ncbi:TPA: hypothetical protein EYP37_11785 [Candidatus Poribacteria bacterium]|nr:hypothetical protein [Candidatus Poribacteria bacterium]